MVKKLVGWNNGWGFSGGSSTPYRHVFLCQNGPSLIQVCKGVAQGSVLGSLLFSIYLLPLELLFRRWISIYADDCQMYVSICNGPDRTIRTIIDGLAEVKLRMSADFLGFNENKTLVIVFTPTGGKDRDIDLLSPFERLWSQAWMLNLMLLWISTFFQMQRLARIKSFISTLN